MDPVNCMEPMGSKIQIRDHQQSWWYDEAPSKGAKVSDWKYKFEINVINSGTAYPPLYKGGPGGIYCNDFKIPLNPPFQRGTRWEGSLSLCL